MIIVNYMEDKTNHSVIAYGGWSLSKENRSASTSGGIAYEIASHLLNIINIWGKI